jgi:hypothetical protein
LTRSVWVDLVLDRNDLEALVDDEEDHKEQKNLDHVHFLEEKEKLFRSFVTLTSSVWVGLVLVRNDLEALVDDEEDQDEQENLDHVHLLEEKEKLLPFL